MPEDAVKASARHKRFILRRGDPVDPASALSVGGSALDELFPSLSLNPFSIFRSATLLRLSRVALRSVSFTIPRRFFRGEPGKRAREEPLR